MTKLLIAFAVAIAIGSTYPFDFQPGDLDAAAFRRVFDACCRISAAGDILSNVAAFAMLGYLGMISARDGTLLLRRALLVLLAGTAFAVALQIAQFYLPSRHESLEDVGWNFIGLLAGAGLGCLLLRPNPKSLTRRQSGTGDPALEGIHSATGLLAVSVNLRQAQVEFLDRIAEELGIDFSQVCRKIIDQMLSEPATGEDGTPGRRAAAAAPHGETTDGPPNDDSLAPTPRASASSWTKRTVMLEPQQVGALRELAEDHGGSLSRAIRRLVAAFMESVVDGTKDAKGRLPAKATVARHRPSDRRRSGGRSRPGGRIPYRQRVATILLGALAAAGFFFSSDNAPVAQGPRIIAAAPWADRNIEILFDHHSHTKYSDGALSVPDLVDLAYKSGCDALAITDHSDGKGTVAIDELADLRNLRRQLSGFLLFGGVEINMPSYGRREHVNVIVDPTMEAEILPHLRDIAEDGVRRAESATEKSAMDQQFLDAVAGYIGRGVNLVMIYNHPSREDPNQDENYKDMIRWNAKGQLFIGFSGAPGHQNSRELGSYRKPLLPIDRWDPVVAEVGGTWDRLLSEGHQFWGAIAGSDFHNSKLDKAPCDFARTHIQADSFTYRAVLNALRAGTFWADHGKILRALSFSVEIAGLPSPVYPGSIVSLGDEHGPIQARVALERGQTADGSPLQVEFIGNCRTGKAEILSAEKLEPDKTTATATIDSARPGADKESCFLRARVRLEVSDGPDLMAYTNPIRIMLR